MQTNNRCIADDLLAFPEDLIPSRIELPFDSIQGAKLGSQTLIQFYTGINTYFVCLLDFESWIGVNCPRFSYYRNIAGSERWELILCSSNYNWNLVEK
jgi:hypothetical protein